MSRRYSRIKQAAKLEAALTQLNAHIANPPAAKIGSKGARPPQTNLYIIPFQITVAANEFVRTKAITSAWTDYEAAFANYTEAALPDNSRTVALKRYRPARVNIITTSGNGAVTASHITGTQYLKYTRTSQSIPFGGNAAQSYQQAIVFNTIRANAVFQTKTLYLIREQFTP